MAALVGMVVARLAHPGPGGMAGGLGYRRDLEEELSLRALNGYVIRAFLWRHKEYDRYRFNGLFICSVWEVWLAE